MCIVRSDGMTISFACGVCGMTINRPTTPRSIWDVRQSSDNMQAEAECDPDVVMRNGQGKKELITVCPHCKKHYSGKRVRRLSDPSLKKYRQEKRKKARAFFHVPQADFCHVLKRNINRQEEKRKQTKMATA